MSNKPYLWTPSKARLQLVKSSLSYNINWLFLPGGPGLGSESLKELTEALDLPGNLWHLDLPGDGSNGIMDTTQDFSAWSKALLEATQALGQVVLAAHSTGGMYALATEGLEDNLLGLVLMDSAPNAEWQKAFGLYAAAYSNDTMAKLQERYFANPSDAILKELTVASSCYLADKSIYDVKNYEFLKTLPYNFLACTWSAEHFDTSYVAKWVPAKIPCLILAGQYDPITPLDLFKKSLLFQKDNIDFREIESAGHFPWIENPQAVTAAFNAFSARLLCFSLKKI